MTQPRIINFQRADARRGTQHRAARPYLVLVDVVWESGATETLRGMLLAWRETGDGDSRTMSAGFVQITAGPGAIYEVWMPGETIRPAPAEAP